MNPLLQSWLLQSFVIFLIVGSIAGAIVGVLLLLRPQSLQRAGQTLNRWISTRHLNQSLERSVDFDPWFYRYRRSSGMLILLGACYILYYFTVSMDRTNTVSGLGRYFKLPPLLVGGLLDALVLSALLGALLAAFVGLFLLLRPSMLRDFEQAANRWVSMRRALKPMETSNRNLDDYVFRHERQAGILLVLGSLYVLVFLLSWIGR
ncbi:MAG: hypothetical protein KKH12_07770 [Gammaproteobacteria bacterium]|nr:hypothetical protein [Gammaproteobacteria bacterium]MBU1481559.1 hypothetical protein [Gammaproteobacteria bacterium]